jgi:hypothetical protein
MNTLRKFLTLTVLLLASNAYADLEVYKDYDISESVSSVTTVKVDANMMDVYLEGLRETWVQSNEIAKELGQIKDYHIYASELPESGDFNLILVVNFEKGEDLEPSKARYDVFMKKWSDSQQKKTRKIVKTYPNVRKITGEYRIREIMMK